MKRITRKLSLEIFTNWFYIFKKAVNLPKNLYYQGKLDCIDFVPETVALDINWLAFLGFFFSYQKMNLITECYQSMINVLWKKENKFW